MSVPYIQAYTNGRLHPATEPSLSPLSRGFLYGDAVYEVWRTCGGTIFAWEEHFRRLEASAAALHFALPFTREEMLVAIRRTVAAYRAASGGTDELYIRLQVSRGAGAIGLDPALAATPDVVLLVQKCPELSAAALDRGVTLAIARELRRNPAQALDPAWKTGNYLNNILGLREARARGADDVLFLNLQGELTEASTANVALVRDGAVVTPPRSAGILMGITRDFLIRHVAPAAGVAVRETAIRPEDLPACREAFILSTTKDLAPVAAIDDVRFEVGSGTVTARLRMAWAAFVRERIAQHPELRVG
jgi:branched-chain amino acid aminotransferase